MKRKRRDIISNVFNIVLSKLDAHSSYLSSVLYKDLKEGTEGKFGGLGVLVTIKDHVLTVIEPIPKSPAYRAGVKRRDKIVAIDNIKTFGTTLDELVENMRGEPGSNVRLTLLRENQESLLKVDLKREVIEIDSVKDKILSDGEILYLKIESFSARTAEDIYTAIKKHKNIKGIVLDLMDNPGGLLDQAIKVADIFLRKGEIVSTKGQSKMSFSAESNKLDSNLPLIVLVNKDSASASEIVASAIQDLNRGLLIGQPTFGKGSVQTVFELPTGEALKLTIARYYSASGRSIQRQGITPDIWLQPLEAYPQNKNILGDFRYKSERFMSYSLQQKKKIIYSTLKNINLITLKMNRKI